MTKTCTKCDKDKSSVEFNKLAASKDGFAWQCRDCHKVNKKKYYLHSRGTDNFRRKRREAMYVTRYGISYGAKGAIVKTQKGKCAGCKSLLIGEPHLDHCHVTGNIRGVLCAGCNKALGLLGDSVERLKSLTLYLSSKPKITVIEATV